MSRGLLAVSLLLAVAGSSAREKFDAPRFVVNLDDEPEQRWTPVLEALLKKHGFEYTMGPVLKYYDSFVPKAAQPVVDLILGDLDKYLGDYGRELRGIADYAKSIGHGKDIPLGKIVGLNLVYEILSSCTGVVAADTEGTIFHGRNLDWGFTVLQNITVNLDFQRNNRTVYSGVTFAAYVGLLTGVRPGAFSIQLDQRSTKNGTLWDNVKEALLDHGKLAALEIRSALEQDDFSAAVKHLSEIPLIVPCYLIMGGSDNATGAVITRERSSTVDIWELGTRNSTFFLVETNYDHWLPPPKDDDRRDPAIAAISHLGTDHVDATTMFGVMETHKVLNHGTVYTAIMSAKTGHLETYIWL